MDKDNSSSFCRILFIEAEAIFQTGVIISR